MKSNMNQYLGVAAALGVVAIFFLFLGFGATNLGTQITSTGGQSADQLAGAGALNGIEQAMVDDETGVISEDIVVGEGAVAETGDTLVVHYVGALEDGTIFDTSRNGNPFQFTIGAGQVIEGWENGIAGMQEGGRRVVVVPPEQAYGSQGVEGVIPPNATLIFEVELLDVQKSPAN